MIIGVPKEIKNHEYRVGLTPENVRELTNNGHHVLVQKNAGDHAGCADDAYVFAGAKICETAAEVFSESDMIVKVKEPQPEECAMLRENQILFTYLHLAPDPDQTMALIDSGAICIAYETVTAANGSLPLLAPMSEVAGRMSIQAAAHHLEKAAGGSGVLMAGVPGVAPAKVSIIGAGVVGRNALQMAVGMGADVTIFDKNLDALKHLDSIYGNRIKTLYSGTVIMEREVIQSDVVIGAVLVPGDSAPKLVNEFMIQNMRPGSVIVDVAIDQGGCFETSVPTTHKDPTYVKHGVVHYCVANMPGAVARTSTFALTNATFPFVSALANNGIVSSISMNNHLRNGLSIYKGAVTSQPVAYAHGLDYVSAENFIN